VPTEAVVKELPTARTQEGEDVLEIGGGTRRRAKRRRIEWPSPRGEEHDACDAAGDLKATRVEVLVRQAVARKVEDRPQEDCRNARPARRAGGGARGHMERDDHGALPSRLQERFSPTARGFPAPMTCHDTLSPIRRQGFATTRTGRPQHDHHIEAILLACTPHARNGRSSKTSYHPDRDVRHRFRASPNRRATARNANS
jgi:hypothetical protein